MKEIFIKNVNTIRLNSYKPICINDFGLNSAARHSLPLYIDGSCRREPDLANPFPSITALCRKGKFAPYLRKNDVVVYITVKAHYPATDVYFAHHRLVGFLKVIETFSDHKAASEWYNERNAPIPSNCLVPDNLPEQFDKTSGRFESKMSIKKFLNEPPEKQNRKGEAIIRQWDSEYKARATEYGNFVVTQPLHINLEDPPVMVTEDFVNIFGKVPITQTANIINRNQLVELAKFAGVNLVII